MLEKKVEKEVCLNKTNLKSLQFQLAIYLSASALERPSCGTWKGCAVYSFLWNRTADLLTLHGANVISAFKRKQHVLESTGKVV